MVTQPTVWSASRVNGTPNLSHPSLVLGQYELIDVIGKGGAAIVYLAPAVY
jgi:hypothetical protein